jgi:indole-3-glycerol phosphate synthase
LELLDEVPAGKTVVSESGIRDATEVRHLEDRGVDAILVGTALMDSDDPEAACRQLLNAGIPQT